MPCITPNRPVDPDMRREVSDDRDERHPAVPVHGRAGRRDRDALAGLLGRARHVPRAQPGRPAGRPGPPAGRRAEAVRDGHVPVPVRGRACTSATRWATSAPTATPGTPAWSGYNVLHPMGFDAFGLPAEQYAVQTGTHPRKTTEANVERYRGQLRRLGLAYDDRRSVRHHRRRVLPLDPVDLPADLQLLVRPGAAQGPPDRRAGRGVRVGRAGHAGRPRVGRPVRGGAAADRRRPPAGLRRARRRSTGARAWARCWPTRRSPPTAAASAATSRSSSAA